ncbi:MAG: FecR family protein [Ardenticatenia bacterium]|nr:FecR family protein [Ardenticatenia bacterium]
MAHLADGLPAASTESPSTGREQLAWVILLTAFAIFCALAVGIPLSIRWYIHKATRPQLATLTSTLGTTLVVDPALPNPFAVAEGARKPDVREQNRIETDANSSAVVRLFDESTVTIFPNSEVTVVRMRTPRFKRSPLPNEIALHVGRGNVRVNIAPPGTRPLRLVVTTPHATVELVEEGS